MASRNLGKCFDATRDPDKIALIEPRDAGAARETSYARLDAMCNALARGLLARGLRRGDRVGILAANSLEYLVAYFGTMRAGLVSVPVSWKLPQETLDYIAEDSGMSLMFHDAPRAAQVPQGVPALQLEEIEAAMDPGAFETVEPVGREVAMMLYTSGSTGRPKGVLLSHDSQLWALERGAKNYGDRADKRYIVAAPMFHMNATINVKSALYAHASIVLLPGFDALAYARAVDRHGVTSLTSVPTMLAMLAREKDRLGGLDFSRVADVSMGSAPLTEALVDKVRALFPNATPSNSYGTTEGGPAPFGPHPHGLPRPPVSVGYPAEGVEVELRESDTPDEGVLWMRSPMVMEGYANLPDKTAAALVDGWYRTGDIMRRDADGFFYFMGRADDMFVTGGENVWPGEVEKMLERMPGLHQACVVPVPDPIKGEVPFAFVVRAADADFDEAAVKAWALAHGPAHAHPRRVAFLPQIPLAGTNKPDRAVLKVMAARIRRDGG